jgi:hypothetical protein
MNNEKYNQIIDDVYKTYWNSVATSEYDPFGPISIKLPTLTQEQFINQIKTDVEFSEKWELKIEERELTITEICELAKVDYDEAIQWTYHGKNIDSDLDIRTMLSDKFVIDIPTKLITITYKNEIIKEKYE